LELRKIEEKNQALADLENVEAAFGDVHRKYERTKQVRSYIPLMDLLTIDNKAKCRHLKM
jgi:hypothetical protein